MNKKILRKKIEQYESVKDSLIEFERIDYPDISFLEIRDGIVGHGTILEEDFENEVYVIIVDVGFFKNKFAYVALKKCDDSIEIMAYSKEGIIKQHIAKDAIRIIAKEFIKNG